MLIFWIYIVIAAINTFMIFNHSNEYQFLAHIFMFIYCMIRAVESSKEDGVPI